MSRTGIPPSPYDVIFSNATLQWVGDHAHLLPRIVRHLAKDGIFAFQVPRNFNDPCHTLIHDIARDDRWAAKLADVRDWWNVLDPEAYFDILEPHARAIDIWETRYVQVSRGRRRRLSLDERHGLAPFRKCTRRQRT